MWSFLNIVKVYIEHIIKDSPECSCILNPLVIFTIDHVLHLLACIFFFILPSFFSHQKSVAETWS